MDKIENILYSIIPLILIILFSWLFSFLGSKMRKQQEETNAAPEKGHDYQLIDLLTDQKPVPSAAESQPAPLNWTTAFPAADQRVPKSPATPGGPQVTPRPIRPKWWGA